MTSDVHETVPAEVRRLRMLDAIGERGFARVSDLSAAFQVSGVTVRSDLDALEERGAIRRVHGGAVVRGATFIRERSFEESLQAFEEEKRQIARTAVDSIEPGDSVFIDVGTTTAAFARALVQREELGDLTLITNGLSIAWELEASIPRNRVVVTGGTLRPLQHSLVAPLASLVLERLHVDVAVLGCNGVDVVAGITNANLEEAELKRMMVERSDRALIVADQSKLGHVHLGRVAGLREVTALVTSVPEDEAIVRDLREAGLPVHLAS